MNQVVLQSLQAISTGYSVFEKDQVLTHDQLNTVAEYFDDQTRLTRVKLLGVGIVCGLRVSPEEAKVTVSKGAGITTDGDLLYFAADTVFDRFKLYDESGPKYAPFSAAITAKKVFELVPKGAEAAADPPAHVLGRFKAETGFDLDQMVAVLFMEGYVKKDDLCTGDDCDNLGQNFINTIKLLFAEKSVAGPLQKAIPTPDRAARALADIVADRPLFSSAVNSTARLAGIYRTACRSIHGKLAAEFPKLYPNCSDFLGDAFTSNPASRWRAKLNRVANAFGASDAGIQYYYDFLKDLAETYNRFRRLLFGDTTWCCPDTDGFPKHLLLGNVVAGADPNENRTGFYPSLVASRTAQQLQHAIFLAQKLDALIETFEVPDATGPARITPSRFEDAPLEERAIPYYYEINSANPIQKGWSYRLHQQGMDAWNYSYNAAAYGAQGGAARPFTSQMGCFSFFRIEGHLGLNVATAQAAIEAEIKANNLPFVVQPVFLGTDKRKVVKRPGIRFTDLHHLHRILRNDLTLQLEDARTFSAHYADQVNKTLTTDDVEDLPQAKTIASQKDRAINDGVQSAKSVLNQSYPEYKINAAAWKPSFKDTLTAAAEFKQNLGKVTKTEFTTPFDSLIGTTHGHWLDWLDILIQDKDDKKDGKLLFSNFVAEHPGLEHFAGVVRGGTFVLVHDNNNRVVADFMLPYHCCEDEPEIEPQEPPLPRPPIKIPGIIRDGIKLTPSFDKHLTRRLDQFTHTVVDPKIESQRQHFEFFKGSMAAVAGVFGAANTGKIKAGDTRFGDDLLDATIGEMKLKQQKVEILKEKAGDPGLPKEVRAKHATAAKKAETELAKSIQDTAKYLSDAGVDVSTGSEGFKAMMEISSGIGKITNERAKTSMKTGLTALQKKTGNAGLKTMLGGMINF
ncbi:MAG TPA: hypothetical protein VNP98_10640 [Chthoniobacterales bacterium]|nr:hypothetical protein [Chthoniobacterales bacterium]